MICEFCKKELANKSSLNYHQKTALYCLKIQESLSEENTIYDDDKIKCEFCDKLFTQNSTLQKHLQICKVKKHYIC